MLDPLAECPECGLRLGAANSCAECGWKPTETKPSLPIYREMEPPTCQHGTRGTRCNQCDAIAEGFMNQIRDLLPKEPEPVSPWPVGVKAPSVMKPICALCVEELLPGDWIYRDARLWHAACWGRRGR